MTRDALPFIVPLPAEMRAARVISGEVAACARAADPVGAAGRDAGAGCDAGAAGCGADVTTTTKAAAAATAPIPAPRPTLPLVLKVPRPWSPVREIPRLRSETT